MTRPRARAAGIVIGRLPTGIANSITDVPGIRVGHATVWRDESDPPAGRGVARTGVTVVVPFGLRELFEQPIPAGGAVLNGAGECTGFHVIREWGLLETPIFLTNTLGVGKVYDAAARILIAADPRIGTTQFTIPVVAECDDSRLNQAQVIQIEAADVARALDAAGQEVAEGAVGAGTGMVCFGCKGGIGTASRVVEPDRIGYPAAGRSFTVGVLVLTNFGRLANLTIAGVLVGGELAARGLGVPLAPEQGSCIALVATDAPLEPRQLERLARRAGLGLSRIGSFAGHTSGEIFLAVSTGRRLNRSPQSAIEETRLLSDFYLDGLFEAVVEATEEAVLNSLFAAESVTGVGGAHYPALPIEETIELLRHHRAIV